MPINQAAFPLPYAPDNSRPKEMVVQLGGYARDGSQFIEIFVRTPSDELDRLPTAGEFALKRDEICKAIMDMLE